MTVTAPRIVSELQRLLCPTCSVLFAVSKDYLYSQLSVGRTIVVCPNGHTMPFTNRQVDSATVVNDLRKRIVQLESELAKKKNAVIPLASRAHDRELDAVVRERTRVAQERSIATESEQVELVITNTNKPKPARKMCPYCKNWFVKPRDHARTFHPNSYKPTDFAPGTK